jgi:DNA topoisomerase-1
MPKNSHRAGKSTLAQPETGLRHVEVDELSIHRRRNGHGFVYLQPNGRRLCDKRTLNRLQRLAVPPAYRDVVYASDPRAHIQAVGRDSAGRRQYRYHPEWDKVREMRKARRLARLVHLLPKIRAALSRHLRGREPMREFALAAVIELIACTAMRAGSESYAQESGTRGAATLLKSNVHIAGDKVALRFRGKGGKAVEKAVRSRRLARVLRQLMRLPGKRLFQYRSDDGQAGLIHRREVNDFLRSIASPSITLKDFRTMIACACALEELSELDPKPSEHGRRKQVRGVLQSVAAELANTPAVCRKSYVHVVVIDAFETGKLARMCKHGVSQSASQREHMLARMLETIAG